MTAADLTRQNLGQQVHIVASGKNYIGILRHFTHEANGVHVLITSSDNAVIICSLRLDPDHEINLPGDAK